MTKAWRFLETGARNGRFNMALDSLLANQQHLDRPVLRLYRWQPFAISLGYHQRADEVDRVACHRAGIDVVRRPTGGRAILHAEEITYCVVIPDWHPLFDRSTRAAHTAISHALLNGLSRLRLPVSLTARERQVPRGVLRNKFACFASTARHEIQCNNRKLVGSAQRRFASAILQHGSIMTGNQHLDLLDFLNMSDADTIAAAKKDLRAATVSLTELLGRSVPYEDLKQALLAGFRETFKIAFEHQPLTSVELQHGENNTALCQELAMQEHKIPS
jgi:lipoate-protein ligase A